MRRAVRVAAVTMVRNEGAMLRAWIDHYGRQVGLDHLLVIDDNSDDGSTDGLDCEVRRIEPIEGHFENSRMQIVSDAARKLLRKHDAVIFADADEFILADPDRYDGLTDIVAPYHCFAQACISCCSDRCSSMMCLDRLSLSARDGASIVSVDMSIAP